jgi:ketosteroid isomerase-like protein
MTARVLSYLLPAMLAACGGGETSTLPDESSDFGGGGGESAFSAEGTTPVGPEAGGTRWRWIEAHCTEGPLDLTARGFAQELRIEADDEGLLLTYDQTFEADSCTHTVVQRARPRGDGRHFDMTEEVRVAQPPTDECAGRMEQQRVGEVRRNGDLLEVLVQRSFVWCNGFEVRMVYAPLQPTLLEGDQIVRRYVAHFNRRDAARVAGLFAESGSLVEPFHVTRTGGASRHDGRAAVQRYYDETFRGVEWLALQLSDVAAEGEGRMVVDWRYVDPRVAEPFAGRNHFTIAAGEIFEARIELTGEPVEGSPPMGPPAREEEEEEEEGAGEATPDESAES